MQAKKYATSKKVYGIGKWAMDERPRKNYLVKALITFPNAELLALILNCGASNKTSVDLATEILKLTENNLAELARIPVQKAYRHQGCGAGQGCESGCLL